MIQYACEKYHSLWTASHGDLLQGKINSHKDFKNKHDHNSKKYAENKHTVYFLK